MNKFDNIKIPDNIDEVTINAIKRGKTEKYKYKRIKKVANIVLVAALSIGVGFPAIIKASPNLESAINKFIESAFPQSYSNKLKEESNFNNLVIKDKKTTVTLDKSTIDNQQFIASMTIESDFLKQYEEDDLNYDLYSLVELGIGDKNNLVSTGTRIKKLENNKATIIVDSYLGDINIDDTVKINLNLESLSIYSTKWKDNSEKKLDGNWNFSYELTKESSINKISVKDNIKLDNKNMTFESIEITPLATYIKLTADENLSNKWTFAKYKIMDNKGNYYAYSQIDTHTDDNGWNYTLAIYDDLSNIESLSITPYTEDTVIESEIYGQDLYKMIASMDKNSEIEELTISRDVEKRDLSLDTSPAGKYEGEKISYYLDIDKNRKFYTLDELIGQEIQTGTQSSVTIEDIKINNRNTTVILKPNGDYQNISHVVLFDEDMKDTYSGVYVTHKGIVNSNTLWNSTKTEQYINGTTTFIIDKLDANKKYKLAVPLQKDIEINPNHTMHAKIKNIIN